MKEEWRDIQGYEGLYQVSNLGNIKSVERKAWNGQAIHILKERILKPQIKGVGYLGVSLRKNNKTFQRYVHRLVAKTFLENTQNNKEVNHIDGNKENNCFTNLEWCNTKYNRNHGYDNNLYPYGEKHHFSKTKNSIVKKIREKFENGSRQKDLMIEFSISKETIHNIVRYKTYKRI